MRRNEQTNPLNKMKSDLLMLEKKEGLINNVTEKNGIMQRFKGE